MNTALREGLRLRAIRAGGPFRLRETRRIPLLADALIWTSVSYPGDASRPLGVMLGKRHEEPAIYICENPRDADARVDFFAAIARDLEAAIMPASPFFQLVVGGSADVRHLVSIAVRAGTIGSSDASGPRASIVRQARRLGLILGYLGINRASYTHQGALVNLSSELAEHIVTPISNSERENLAIQLAYAEPGRTDDERRAAAARAIKEPSDHRLLGMFDDTITQTLRDFDGLGEGEGDPGVLREQLLELLWPLRRLHEAAYDHIASFESDGAGAAYIAQSETDALDSLRDRLKERPEDTDYTDKNGQRRITNPIQHMTGRQSVAASISEFIRQEHFHDKDDHEMIRIDAVARASARLDGTVLAGRVCACTRVGPKTVIEVASTGEIAEFEVGDKVDILDWRTFVPHAEATTMDAKITGLALEGPRIIYTLELRIHITIAQNAEIEFVEETYKRGTIFDVSKARFAEKTWTHSEESMPRQTPRRPTSPNRVNELFQQL